MQDPDRALRAQARQLSDFTAKLDAAQQRLLVDSLTGLASRPKTEAYLRFQLENHQPVSILLVDLDGFKRVNAACGHAVGDQLLREVARTLSERLEPFEMVGRWQGDKFLMLASYPIPDLQRHASATQSRVRRQYIVSCGAKFQPVHVTASCGFAQAGPGDNVAGLLARAEASLTLSREQAQQAAPCP